MLLKLGLSSINLQSVGTEEVQFKFGDHSGTHHESDDAILRSWLVTKFTRSKRKQSASQPLPNIHAASAQMYRLQLASKVLQYNTLEAK